MMGFFSRKTLFRVVAVLIGVPVILVASLAVIPPVATPLMIMRTLGYGATPKTPAPHGWEYAWVPLNKIAPALARAVIAAEDTTFCSHHGFDREAYNRAWERFLDGVRVTRGGSTISQQTAKNVFLWPGRNVLRKGLETLLTPLVEIIWGKTRIMEIYLNVVEWAPGVYGAEAAARHHFNVSARQLSPRQAALLAAVLPNPRHWSAGAPGPYVESRVATIMARAANVDARCVKR
jgi:monofunctional biosynthetic peptidoglycan transglycosylase